MIIHCRWEHAVKQRYYRIIFGQDLFGDWLLTKVWGGLNKASGRIMHIRCVSYEDGLKLISKITKIRATRGYVMV